MKPWNNFPDFILLVKTLEFLVFSLKSLKQSEYDSYILNIDPSKLYKEILFINPFSFLVLIILSIVS